MFHQTNNAELFHTAEKLKAEGFKRSGPIWKKRKTIFLPLYEAKMIQMFDHRAASIFVKDANWMRQGQTDTTPLVQHQNPEFFVEPRWWVDEAKVLESIGLRHSHGFIGFKDITSPTNQRTMIAASISWSAVTNHFPLILTEQSARQTLCLLANLNSFPLDFTVRQKIGGVTLNFFIVEQLPVFSPDFYKQKCPWNKKQTLKKWISDRVLKLTCTSNDMIPLAEATGFKPRVHKWNPSERLDLQAQLDAAFFLLYGTKRPDVEYILSTFSGVSKENQTLLDDSSISERILGFYDEFRRTQEHKEVKKQKKKGKK